MPEDHRTLDAIERTTILAQRLHAAIELENARLEARMEREVAEISALEHEIASLMAKARRDLEAQVQQFTSICWSGEDPGFFFTDLSSANLHRMTTEVLTFSEIATRPVSDKSSTWKRLLGRARAPAPQADRIDAVLRVAIQFPRADLLHKAINDAASESIQHWFRHSFADGVFRKRFQDEAAFHSYRWEVFRPDFLHRVCEYCTPHSWRVEDVPDPRCSSQLRSVSGPQVNNGVSYESFVRNGLNAADLWVAKERFTFVFIEQLHALMARERVLPRLWFADAWGGIDWYS